MIGAPRAGRASDERGFALIEVIVSALIVLLVTGAVLELLSSTGRTGAEQRHHSQAYAIAQEDQARLRAMRIPSLQTEMPPRTVTLNGTPYEVTSSATFVSEKTGTTECGSEARADYIKVGSHVTWPSMREGAEPVTIESIDSPVSGSIDPTSGSLAVTVISPPNRVGEKSPPVSGAGITGTGPAAFSGSTDMNGCVLFGRQPAGNYVVTPRLGAEFVDQNGRAPSAKPIGIVGGATRTLAFEFGKAGAIGVSFLARQKNGEEAPAKADSITIFDTGMEAPRTFGTPGSTPISTIKAERLFPFPDTYNVYAGACTDNKVEVGSADIHVPSAGTVEGVVNLPVLYLKVVNGGPQVPVSGARVTLTDPNCTVSSKPVKRSFVTSGEGGLTEPGVPAGIYELCASAKLGTISRSITASGVKVASPLGNSPDLVLDLAKGTPGTVCP